MQSVSPRGRLELMAVPGMAWERTREAVPVTTVWSAVIVFALAFTIARSTVAAQWVPGGIDLIPFVAVGGAILMSLLAVTPLPAWLCVTAGAAAGPVVGILVTSSEFRLEYPFDPSGAGLVQLWIIRLFSGSAFGDQAFVGLLITLLMWITGAWLAWCVIRWRQPLIGLIPGAAAFATNVLNTNNQQGYTFVFLALTLGLLLWTTYTASMAKAIAARIRMTGDARWDFWETGLVATAGLLVVGIMLPPISTTDRTATMESSLFQSWAQVTSKLNAAGKLGSAPGGAAATTGFSDSVSLGAQLTQSKTPVFSYTITGGYPGPEYFRGVNLGVIAKGPDGNVSWVYGGSAKEFGLAPGDAPNYSENYKSLALATFTVNMVQPPGGDDEQILFYPGQLYSTSRQSKADEVFVPPVFAFSSQLISVDRLDALNPNSSRGTYNVTVEYPDITADSLRAAGSDYAEWLSPYTALPAGVESPDVYAFIHKLALDVTAGATNPYDKATLIEQYLRSGVFTYHLKPKQAPPGTDPLFYFLNNSHDGYCQYFAMAMGEMLRSLGIPTRLVSGYGRGTFDDISHRTIVKNEDAHVWVESYFPGYGWIPFEPTNDGVYQPVQRGISLNGLCLRDNNCTIPVGPGTTLPTGAPRSPNRTDVGGSDQPVSANQSRAGWLDSTLIMRMAAVLFALLLVLLALAVRYLRPRTVMGVWRRVLVLARLAGAEFTAGETPLELDRRLARAFPEAAPHLHALTGSFVVAAYAPPDMAEATKPSVMEAWSSLRPMMVRRVLRRVRPGRS